MSIQRKSPLVLLIALALPSTSAIFARNSTARGMFGGGILGTAIGGAAGGGKGAAIGAATGLGLGALAGSAAENRRDRRRRRRPKDLDALRRENTALRENTQQLYKENQELRERIDRLEAMMPQKTTSK